MSLFDKDVAIHEL